MSEKRIVTDVVAQYYWDSLKPKAIIIRVDGDEGLGRVYVVSSSRDASSSSSGKTNTADFVTHLPGAMLRDVPRTGDLNEGVHEWYSRVMQVSKIPVYSDSLMESLSIDESVPGILAMAKAVTDNLRFIWGQAFESTVTGKADFFESANYKLFRALAEGVVQKTETFLGKDWMVRESVGCVDRWISTVRRTIGAFANEYTEAMLLIASFFARLVAVASFVIDANSDASSEARTLMKASLKTFEAATKSKYDNGDADSIQKTASFDHDYYGHLERLVNSLGMELGITTGKRKEKGKQKEIKQPSLKRPVKSEYNTSAKDRANVETKSSSSSTTQSPAPKNPPGLKRELDTPPRSATVDAKVKTETGSNTEQSPVGSVPKHATSKDELVIRVVLLEDLLSSESTKNQILINQNEELSQIATSLSERIRQLESDNNILQHDNALQAESIILSSMGLENEVLRRQNQELLLRFDTPTDRYQESTDRSNELESENAILRRSNEQQAEELKDLKEKLATAHATINDLRNTAAQDRGDSEHQYMPVEEGIEPVNTEPEATPSKPSSSSASPLVSPSSAISARVAASEISEVSISGVTIKVPVEDLRDLQGKSFTRQWAHSMVEGKWTSYRVAGSTDDQSNARNMDTEVSKSVSARIANSIINLTKDGIAQGVDAVSVANKKTVTGEQFFNLIKSVKTPSTSSKTRKSTGFTHTGTNSGASSKYDDRMNWPAGDDDQDGASDREVREIIDKMKHRDSSVRFDDMDVILRKLRETSFTLDPTQIEVLQDAHINTNDETIKQLIMTIIHSK